jgi:protocatechuate 3,4-dioxygenase, beta subunit
MARFLPLSRRRLIESAAALAVGLPLPARGAALPPTPRQTAGPFYPAEFPPEIDEDLALVAGRAPAAGAITLVGGRVLAADGRPLAGATVEIWQCDASGRYHHPADRRGPADPGFQGYGRTRSDAEGGYRFRTIRPAPYPGRTPHIHFRVVAPGLPPLVTQMYVADEPGNEHDPVLQAVRDPAARRRLVVPLLPAPEIERNALSGRFDIVLGA